MRNCEWELLFQTCLCFSSFRCRCCCSSLCFSTENPTLSGLRLLKCERRGGEGEQVGERLLERRRLDFFFNERRRDEEDDFRRGSEDDEDDDEEDECLCLKRDVRRTGDLESRSREE